MNLDSEMSLERAEHFKRFAAIAPQAYFEAAISACSLLVDSVMQSFRLPQPREQKPYLTVA